MLTQGIAFTCSRACLLTLRSARADESAWLSFLSKPPMTEDGIFWAFEHSLSQCRSPVFIPSSNRALVCGVCGRTYTHTHTHTSCCTQTQAWRSPHLIILVLTWEKGPSVFASALFEFARVFFGDGLCENHSKGQSRA